MYSWYWLIELGLNETSTLVGHFVSSPREREKRDRRDSRDEREGKGRKRNRNESEETGEIKTPPSTLTWYKDSRPCPTVSQSQLDAPVTQDTRHLRHTRPPPNCYHNKFCCCIWCEICHECSKPAIWKGAHWCECWPCTCMLIKNPITIWWYDIESRDKEDCLYFISKYSMTEYIVSHKKLDQTKVNTSSP